MLVGYSEIYTVNLFLLLLVARTMFTRNSDQPLLEYAVGGKDDLQSFIIYVVNVKKN